MRRQKDEDTGLTPKQERFAQLVAGGMPNGKAYREAFESQASDDTCNRRGYDHVRAPAIVERVRSLRAQVADQAVLQLVDVLNETRRLMLATPAKLVRVDANGKVTFKLPHELDPDTAAAIASFEIDDLGRVKYRFWDKNAALDRAAKILGAFERDNRQKRDALTELMERLVGNVIGPSPEAARLPGVTFSGTEEEDD